MNGREAKSRQLIKSACVVRTYSESINGVPTQSGARVFVVGSVINVEETVTRFWIRHLQCIQHIRRQRWAPIQIDCLGAGRSQNGRKRSRWRRSHRCGPQHFTPFTAIKFDNTVGKERLSTHFILVFLPNSNFVASGQSNCIAGRGL